MPVTFGSIATSAFIPNGTSKTWACTIAAADTMLLVAAGNDTSNGPPTSVTYNAVALTSLGPYNPIAGMNLSWWYLNNPSVGAFNVIASGWPTNTTGFGAIAIPLQGADLSRAPLLGTGANGVSTSPACSVSGGGANDLQLASVIGRSTTCSSAGAPQGVVVSSPTMPILSINSLDSFSSDSITLGSAGNFAWTIASGTWVCQGVTIFSLPPTTYSLESHEYF